MLIHVDTSRLHVAVYVDGRHTAARQWDTITAEVSRQFPGATISGAEVITDNRNRRPYYLPGQRLRG